MKKLVCLFISLILAFIVFGCVKTPESIKINTSESEVSSGLNSGESQTQSEFTSDITSSGDASANGSIVPGSSQNSINTPSGSNSKTGSSNTQTTSRSTNSTSNSSSSSNKYNVPSSLARNPLGTGLPSVYLTTANGWPITSRTDYISGECWIVGGTTSYSTLESGGGIQVRGRGNSSWEVYNKKSYRVKFDKKMEVLNIGAARDWTLIASHSDKTLMRNFLAFSMAGSLSNLKFSPKAQFVDLFLNGEYMGLYTVGDQVEIGKDRVNISEASGTDRGYLLEVDNRVYTEYQHTYFEGIDYFRSIFGHAYVFQGPSRTDITQAQREFISDYVWKLENLIKAGSSNYKNYLNEDSFIDWLIMEELTKNVDSAFGMSVFMYKDKGGKINMGPLWDFDLAFGNADYADMDKTYGWYIAGDHLYELPDKYTLGAEWAKNLLKQPAFANKFISRWNTLKLNQLSKSKIFGYIDSSANVIRSSWSKNMNKWKIMGHYVWPNPPGMVSALTFDEQVNYLKSWIDLRWNWLDENINAKSWAKENI